MSEILKQQAELAAQRVDSDEVGFDPLTILTIITQVLPLLASCFSRNDEPNPQLASASLKRYYERAPESCRRRTARRVRAESDEPMTKDQSFKLAQAIIDQACACSPDEVEACCRAAG